VLELPRIARDHWPRVFATLADYAAANAFNLTEASQWCSEALAGETIPVGRSAIAYVARGCQYGGARLDEETPPDAAEIARAFLDAVLDRAGATGVTLEPDAEREVADWLGVAFAE